MAGTKKKKHGARPRTSGGGSMMRMRGGFRGMVGGKKKSRRGRKDISFFTVFGWCVFVALLGVFAWSIGGV